MEALKMIFTLLFLLAVPVSWFLLTAFVAVYKAIRYKDKAQLSDKETNRIIAWGFLVGLALTILILI